MYGYMYMYIYMYYTCVSYCVYMIWPLTLYSRSLIADTCITLLSTSSLSHSSHTHTFHTITLSHSSHLHIVTPSHSHTLTPSHSSHRHHELPTLLLLLLLLLLRPVLSAPETQARETAKVPAHRVQVTWPSQPIGVQPGREGEGSSRETLRVCTARVGDSLSSPRLCAPAGCRGDRAAAATRTVVHSHL